LKSSKSETLDFYVAYLDMKLPFEEISLCTSFLSFESTFLMQHSFGKSIERYIFKALLETTSK